MNLKKSARKPWFKRQRIVPVALLLLLVISASSALLYKKYRPAAKVGSGDTKTTQTTSPQSETQSQTPPSQDQTADPIGIAPQPGSAASGAFATTKPNLSVTIDRTSINNGHLSVDLTIAPDSTTGACSIELLRPDKPLITVRGTVVYESRKPKCSIQPIDVSGLEKGTWAVTAKITAGNNAATATSEVTLR